MVDEASDGETGLSLALSRLSSAALASPSFPDVTRDYLDLGCTPLMAFWKVTFPLSLPGVLAGSMLVFIPAVGEFVVPDLLGGSETLMIGKTLWSEFFANRDWPVASAVAILLLLILVLPIVYFQRVQAKARESEV